MGELPMQVVVHFEDGDETMILYVCHSCKILFAVGADPQGEEPFCPVCGKREGVEMLEEYT